MRRFLLALRTIFTALPTWLIAASITLTTLSPTIADALAAFLAADRAAAVIDVVTRLAAWLAAAAIAVRNLTPAIRKGWLTLEQERDLAEDA